LKEFKIKDYGFLKYCLGVDETRTRRRKREHFADRVVKIVFKRFKMSNSKPVLTPGDPDTKLDHDEHYTDEQGKRILYRELIKSLMFLSVATHSDVSHIVSSLNQFNENLSKVH